MPGSPVIQRSLVERLSRFSIWHTGSLAIATAWMFGGKIYWARLPLSLWGSLALVLTVAGFIRRKREDAPVLRPALWLAPGALLISFIAVSSFNPSFEVRLFYDSPIYRPIEPVSWLPSSAKPSQTRSELWLFAGLYLAGFNLALNATSLSRLQRLMVVLAANATVIAVFGTLQKLTGQDMFFGLQKSPNPTFFGSFIYHNHWGPYALMSLCMWLASISWLSRDDHGRGFLHSPAVGSLAAALLIAATIPLSTSRSSTAMLGGLAIAALAGESWRLHRRAKKTGRSARGTISWLAAGALATAIACYALGADVIQQRLQTTREQIADMRAQGTVGERAILYRLTTNLWQAKPWAGWGFETWELMYRRTTPLKHRGDRLPIYYDQAHSDWLQALAETGAIGTGCLLLMGGIPLWMTRHRLFVSPATTYLLAGPAMIAVYAWVEFPLANPAVVVTFWISFFAALRFAQMSSH